MASARVSDEDIFDTMGKTRYHTPVEIRTGEWEQEMYQQRARQIDAWLRTHLQDPDDGLYWDNVQMNGRVDRTKFPYNTALVIQANVWWYRLTRRGLPAGSPSSGACWEKY